MKLYLIKYHINYGELFAVLVAKNKAQATTIAGKFYRGWVDDAEIEIEELPNPMERKQAKVIANGGYVE